MHSEAVIPVELVSPVGSYSKTIDISGISPGIYQLQIKTESGIQNMKLL